MSKIPLYIKLLSNVKDSRHHNEWIDLAGLYQDKLQQADFYTEFKEELIYLSDQGDIVLQGNLDKQPAPAELQLSAQITESGEEYLRTYKYAVEDKKDKFSNGQIIMLMGGIVAATAVLAFLLTYFFG